MLASWARLFARLTTLLVIELRGTGPATPCKHSSAALKHIARAMDTQDTAEVDFLQTNPASTSGRSDAEQLKGALMNEKAAPEILQYETDLVGRIESNMDYQVRCWG